MLEDTPSGVNSGINNGAVLSLGVNVRIKSGFFFCRVLFAGLIYFCFVPELRQTAFARASSVRDRHQATFVSNPAEVTRAIDLATGYLVHACGPDGKFAYRVEIGSDKEISSYNIIRHAGATYALSMANHYHSDPAVVATMIRAATFLRRNYIRPGARGDQLAVWSRPVAAGSASADNFAELGGTGLGLVALAAVREVDPKAVSLEELESLGRFLLFLQKEDGSFVHKYRADSGPVTSWQSLYYPGEAALGLVALYEADGSRQWLTAASKALSYLAKSRSGQTIVPADHWALIASARLLRHCKENACAALREKLARHAAQICNSILHEQIRIETHSVLDGAFDLDGRTAPAATRLEGLLAASEFLPHDDLRLRIEAASERGIAFLLRAQIGSGPQAGGIPGAIFNRARDSDAIRIDYVQHALSAWLSYQRDARRTD